METRSIGHVTQAPHGPTDHASAVGEGTKTEETHPMSVGDRSRLTRRDSQTDLQAVYGVTRKGIGQGRFHGWEVVVDDGCHLSAKGISLW